MSNISGKVLEEGNPDEKSGLIAEGSQNPTPSDQIHFAGIQDLLLVFAGISAITVFFLLLKTFYILPSFLEPTSLGNILSPQSTCHDPPFRREWRDLEESEKIEFIDAIICLTQKPSKLGLQATRYDDFVYVHVKQYTKTHNVAPSLPWHRYYIKIFENTLQDECNFKGQLPYWDWTLDASMPENSSIWSAANGFGGNGSQNSHCLESGPFVNLKPNYPYKHCLRRNFVPGMLGFNYTKEKIEDLWGNSTSYHDFRTRLESGAHKSVHNGIGGEMPTHGSSNDPVFFVHHGQIDRIWWHWQQLQPQQRLEDYFGPNNINEPDVLSQATLQDTLAMMGLGTDRPVADMMDPGSNLLCYKY